MKIAVTYDNGNIFQHFGKTENFKIFEVENGAGLPSFQKICGAAECWQYH